MKERRASQQRVTERDGEGEWKSEKILIKKICSVEQLISNIAYLLFTVKEKWLKRLICWRGKKAKIVNFFLAKIEHMLEMFLDWGFPNLSRT
jgi:hypothetical protein